VATVPLSLFARYAVFVAGTAYANWDTISGLFDRAVAAPTSPIFGMYLQNVFEMKDGTGAFTSRERGMFGVHYVNTTGGDLDTTWTTADYVAVESAVQNFWTTIGASISSGVRLVEHRWYPYGPGVHSPNPPRRITTIATPVLGSGTDTHPHQVACTVTLRTPLRKHWGRIYLPFIGQAVSTGGQYSAATIGGVGDATRAMFLTPQTSQGITPVVWDRNRNVALSVTQLEVDSVPDIIRRRRPRTTQARYILST
jgi:hypothetical protein